MRKGRKAADLIKGKDGRAAEGRISPYEIITPSKIELGLDYLSFSGTPHTSHLSIQLTTVDSSG